MVFSLYYSPGGTLQNCFKYEACDKPSCKTCEFHMVWNEPRTTQLQDMDAEHIYVPYHSNVLWLSLGKVLKAVWTYKKSGKLTQLSWLTCCNTET